MVSLTIFLLPLTATAAAVYKPRAANTVEVHHPDEFMAPTVTLDNVVTHSAGFLAPTASSEEIVHRPDELMAPTATPNEPVHRPDDLMAPTTTPEAHRPDDFMAPPTTPVSSSTVGVSPSSSESGWLQVSFTSDTPTPTPTPIPSSTHPLPVLNPTLISWASWVTAPPPAPAFTYAPSDISFASWVNPSTLLTTPSPSLSPTPTPYPSGSNPGDFLLCVDTDFTGECTYIHSVTYLCQNLPSQFQRRATSIRPDRNQTCQFYDAEDCHGQSDWMRWPGSGNMRGRRFDERVVSWMCREDGCEGVHGAGGCSENADGTPKVWG